MVTPLEILTGPLKIYLAPVGEAMPAVDATPAGNWLVLGTSGEKSYSEDGVTISQPQTIEEIFVAGSTGPVKAVRTQEGLMVAVTIYDMTMEEYVRCINNVAATDVAAGLGTVGTRTTELRRGPDVVEFALVAKGLTSSPELASVPAQFQILRAYVGGEPSLVFTKGKPVGLTMEFHALEDSTASTDAERFGQFVYQHQAAL